MPNQNLNQKKTGEKPEKKKNGKREKPKKKNTENDT
jgi:hypothetical protein